MPLELREEVVDYLRARELVTNVYLERQRRISLATGEQVIAVTYIADAQHEQYAGRLGHEALIAQIKGAVGKSGPNESYITDTNDHLVEMGIKDGLMARISQELKQV